jgi:hypothetical protein
MEQLLDLANSQPCDFCQSMINAAAEELKSLVHTWTCLLSEAPQLRTVGHIISRRDPGAPGLADSESVGLLL